MRALLLQILYTIRSERQLMEQLDYNVLYRWFVGLNPDDTVWVPTVFTTNRERLLEGDIAEAFFQRVLAQANTRQLLSHEHFTVDGTVREAWASHKSVQPMGNRARRSSGDDDPKNPTVDFLGETRSKSDASVAHRSECALGAQEQGGPRRFWSISPASSQRIAAVWWSRPVCARPRAMRRRRPHSRW